MKSNRAKFASVVLDNGNILIMGGKLDGVRVANWEEYSYIQRRVIQTGKLTSPRSGFGAVIHEDYVYVLGGNDGNGIKF